MLEQVQIKRHASVQRKKKGLKHFTRNLSSHRPLTFSTPIIQTCPIVPHNRFRRKKPLSPLREIYEVPPPPPRNTTNVIKSASRPRQSFESHRSSKKLAPIPGGEPPQPSLPPPSLLRNFLDRYCIIIGESVARSSSSPSRAGRGWKRCRSIRSSQLWQKASAETCTISCKERNRGQRGNPVSIAPVTNVVKDRYESSLASNTKSGEGKGEVIPLRIS